MVLYRICWRDEKGQTGNGEKILSLESADAWLVYLRNKYPEMKHWLSTE
jgi:hypothetical protein